MTNETHLALKKLETTDDADETIEWLRAGFDVLGIPAEGPPRVLLARDLNTITAGDGVVMLRDTADLLGLTFVKLLPEMFERSH